MLASSRYRWHPGRINVFSCRANCIRMSWLVGWTRWNLPRRSEHVISVTDVALHNSSTLSGSLQSWRSLTLSVIFPQDWTRQFATTGLVAVASLYRNNWRYLQKGLAIRDMQWRHLRRCYNTPPCWRYSLSEQNWVKCQEYDISYAKVIHRTCISYSL